MIEPLLWGGGGGLLIVYTTLLAVALRKINKDPERWELNARLNALTRDVDDMVQRVDTWMRREQTQAARQRKREKEIEQVAEPVAAPAPPLRRKDQLRQQLAQRLRGNGGME